VFSQAVLVEKQHFDLVTKYYQTLHLLDDHVGFPAGNNWRLQVLIRSMIPSKDHPEQTECELKFGIQICSLHETCFGPERATHFRVIISKFEANCTETEGKLYYNFHVR
jgi:hypothetical protein